MSLTRGDIKKFTSQELKEFQGTDAGNDPFLYDSIIQRTVDEICRDTFAYYTYRTTNLIAGQATYCIPDNIFRFKTALVLDISGNWCPLWKMELWKGDDRLSPSWRNDTSADPPTKLFWSSRATHVTLDPTPSVARTNALRFEGYAVPGSVWELDVDGNPVTITDSTPIPLPVEFEDCVLLGVKARRASEFAHPQRQEFKEDYIKAKRRLEGLVRTALPDQSRIAVGG